MTTHRTIESVVNELENNGVNVNNEQIYMYPAMSSTGESFLTVKCLDCGKKLAVGFRGQLKNKTQVRASFHPHSKCGLTIKVYESTKKECECPGCEHYHIHTEGAMGHCTAAECPAH